MEKPIVIIYISGGVAEWETEGDVEVHLIDSDNIKAGDAPTVLSDRALGIARGIDPEGEGRFYKGRRG